MEVEVRTKRWGSSLGIILPKHIVDMAQIRENEQIVVEIKKRRFARELFGLLPQWDKPTERIKEEMKRGW